MLPFGSSSFPLERPKVLQHPAWVVVVQQKVIAIYINYSEALPKGAALVGKWQSWSFSSLYSYSSDSVDHRTDGWIIQWKDKSSGLSSFAPSSLVDMARDPFISMLLGSEWMWILQGWPCCKFKLRQLFSVP